MNIDHVGVVVRSLPEGIDYWKRAFGYEQATEAVVNSRQRVKVVFLAKPGSLPVKLVEPLDETSPVYAFSRRGGGLHHLCFKCRNLEAELERLSEVGVRVLVPPQPGEAFENEAIAFVLAFQGLNVELVDTDRRAKPLAAAAAHEAAEP